MLCTMRRITKTLVAAATLIAMATTLAGAYEYSEVVKPGETISIYKSELFDSKGNAIPSEVEFTTSNFSIGRKTITRGANLIEEIKIHNRSEELQIIFSEDKASAAPNRPNVVISELSVKSRRTIRDGSDTIMRSDTYYKSDPISFRVGLDTEDWDVDSDGTTVTLNDGDKKYIEWTSSSSGRISVDYAGVAYTEGRVYDGDKVLYYCSTEVDEKLEDANPSAFISAINMGTSEFPTSVTVQLIANKSDYIYEYNNGKLTAATGLKWNNDDYAWVGKIPRGKHYVFSDTKLRSVSGGTVGGATSDDDYDDYDDDSSTTTPNDPSYYNPETGGGSNVAVAISAIAAILAIAALSIIMSTILGIKKK